MSPQKRAPAGPHADDRKPSRETRSAKPVAGPSSALHPPRTGLDRRGDEDLAGAADDTIAKLTQSANPESRVLELWLDTSVARNAPASPSVYLVMHTFRPSSSLEAAVAKAIQTDDQGFVEDIQQDVSAQERVELFDVDPRWATGAGFLEAGGFTAIAEHLTQAARAGGALEHYAAIFLYWVGGLEQLAWIKGP